MKRIHRQATEVPQAVADRGTELIERHLNTYGVARASDLPEEGKVRLYRDLQQFFARELPNGPPQPPPGPGGVLGWLRRAVDFLLGG
ncbi:MAG: hypothetical protein HY320_02330 [Armatimonadetes bacterium]|nr:hypothetical protein [Armatimonadota bacterium]